MKHEKVLIRQDGTRCRISVELSISYSAAYWNVLVETCAPKKRTWVNVHNSETYAHRSLSIPDRERDILDKQLEYVTELEILGAKRELIALIPLTNQSI